MNCIKKNQNIFYFLVIERFNSHLGRMSAESPLFLGGFLTPTVLLKHYEAIESSTPPSLLIKDFYQLEKAKMGKIMIGSFFKIIKYVLLSTGFACSPESFLPFSLFCSLYFQLHFTMPFNLSVLLKEAQNNQTL